MISATLLQRRNRRRIGINLLAVYLIWGSTYLVITYAVAELPPFLMNALRFTSAGIFLYTLLRLRGIAPPTRRQVCNAAGVGVLLVCGSNGLVTFAEYHGAPSGMAAMALATVSLWAGLWSGLLGAWPSRRSWLGIGLGLVGVVVLSTTDGLLTKPLSMLVFAAPICWSWGSVIAKRLNLPAPLMATAIEMLAGGLLSIIIGLLLGERLIQIPSPSAIAAVAYLTLFGSLIAYVAYNDLLQRTSPLIATSFSYVNPLIAVLLGVLVAGEPLGWRELIALPLILIGLGVVASATMLPSDDKTLTPHTEKLPSEAG